VGCREFFDRSITRQKGETKSDQSEPHKIALFAVVQQIGSYFASASERCGSLQNAQRLIGHLKNAQSCGDQASPGTAGNWAKSAILWGVAPAIAAALYQGVGKQPWNTAGRHPMARNPWRHFEVSDFSLEKTRDPSITL
jgi:hypothetical protein